MKPTLFIDYRERSGLEKGVMKHCEKEGIPYQMQENLITDYCYGNIGIEAKSIHDTSIPYTAGIYSTNWRTWTITLNT